ncbi:tyrosyl-DNA phosphodiesterase 2-like [Clytia hemisphaerica]|uniref:Tyrosyl-DNA phosphodiesterase 2 n=1 Tax=Clytia hemisphaerica TaxID=252671 RepID=A0A7M5VAP2_9CNID
MEVPTSSTAKRKQREVVVLSDDDNDKEDGAVANLLVPKKTETENCDGDDLTHLLNDKDNDIIVNQPVPKKAKTNDIGGDDLTYLLNDKDDDIIAKQPVPKKAQTNDSGKDDLTHLLNDDDDDLAFYGISAQEDVTSKVSSSEAPPQEGSKEFTVLSWNIDGLEDEYLMERFQGALKDILKKLPTIVMLQEVVQQTFLSLFILFPLYVIRTLEHDGYFNVIMFLKKPHVKVIGELEGWHFYSSQMDRHCLLQKLYIHGKPVTVMTSHLESLKECAAERQKQLKQCFETITDSPSDTNFIFAGDLNMRAEDLRQIGGIPPKITDAWETAGEDPNSKFTWDLELNDNKKFGGNRKPRARFDRMYFKRAQSNPMQCIGFELIGLERLSCGMFPSDHFGILSKFILPDD